MSKQPGKAAICSRLDWIKQQLEAGEHINCTSIVKQYGCARKTANRDIDFLRQHYGLEIEYDPDKHTYKLKS